MAKGKGGRPTKYSPEILKSICRYLAEGLPFKYACRINGISEDSGEDWRKKYPEFLGRTAIAHSIGVQGLLNRALDQGSAWKALKNFARGDFIDQETVIIKPVEELPDAELYAEAKKLLEENEAKNKKG